MSELKVMWKYGMENKDIKWNKYKFIYNSYDNNIIQTITNNISIRQYQRKNYNKIIRIILRINMHGC